jgi:subtilase family serine protease
VRAGSFTRCGVGARHRARDQHSAVTTPTAETLGVQGFSQMMNAVHYVRDNHLADVISMSLGAGEGTFSGAASLIQLRQALFDAQANHVTVLASSGDGGTSNRLKQAVKNPGSGLL